MKTKPKICIVGIGGGGCNAIKNMYHDLREKVDDKFFDFIAMNTDAQSLLEINKLNDKPNFIHEDSTQKAVAKIKTLQLGEDGLGAGSDPEKGRTAAEISSAQIKEMLEGCDMAILMTGLGGGTGSGSTPVVSDIIKREIGAIVVTIATKPFSFEGSIRQEIAEHALDRCIATADLVVKIANQNLLGIIPAKTPIKQAFKVVDQICATFVDGIIGIIEKTGLVNLDFADIRTTIQDGGIGVIGFGEGFGENAASIAVDAAIRNQLFDVFTSGARKALVHIVGNNELSLVDIELIVTSVQKMVLSRNARIIYGAAIDPDLGRENLKRTIEDYEFGRTNKDSYIMDDANKIVKVMIIAVASPDILVDQKNNSEMDDSDTTTIEDLTNNFKSVSNIRSSEDNDAIRAEEILREQKREKGRDLLSILADKWRNIN